MIRHSPGGASGKELACQGRRLKFDPWVGQIPWRRAGQPAPGVLAWRMPWVQEPGGLQSTGLQSQTRLSRATQGTKLSRLSELRQTPRLLPGPGRTRRDQRGTTGVTAEVTRQTHMALAWHH